MAISFYRRNMIVAITSAAAMLSFLMLYDEPMSAPYRPTLKPYRVIEPQFTKRVGRRDNFKAGINHTGETLRYLDSLIATAQASAITLPRNKLSEIAVYDPWAMGTAYGGYDSEQGMETPVRRIPDSDIIGFAPIIRPEDYDFGRYKSMALRGIRHEEVSGFLHIPLVFGSSLMPATEGRGVAERVGSAVSRFTGIRTFADGHVYLDSPRLLVYPVLYITARHLFDLTARERENLRRYLELGGFIIMDNTAPRMPYNGLEASFNKMVREVIGSRGRFALIPNDHPIYHSLFDFDVAPIGREIGSFNLLSVTNVYPTNAKSSVLAKEIYYLDGIWFDGRLAGIFTDKGYSVDLLNEISGTSIKNTSHTVNFLFNNNSYEASYPSFLPSIEFSGTPEYHFATFKFVANMVVYALLDPYGMTQRRMREAME